MFIHIIEEYNQENKFRVKYIFVIHIPAYLCLPGYCLSCFSFLKLKIGFKVNNNPRGRGGGSELLPINSLK